MLVFIDECLPEEAFRSILEPRGLMVMSVGEAFPSGSPDPAILAAAEAEGAVVFTSDSDWKTLVRNIKTEQGRAGVRRAGRVLFNCEHPVAIQRLEELIDDIEHEFGRSQQLGTLLVMRITKGNFRVER